MLIPEKKESLVCIAYEKLIGLVKMLTSFSVLLKLFDPCRTL